MEREIKMRKLLGRHFSRQPDEFENEVSYNDYLEEYENVLFELLELKTETAVKERIAQLKATSSILNSTPVARDEEVPEIKRKKVAENLWCIYQPVEMNLARIADNSKIPNGFIVPDLPGGQTERVILDFISFSLFELNARS